MTLHNIFYEKLIPILSLDEGPKILLFDPETITYFSNIIAHSTFLEYDFFVFDNVNNKTRQKISQMTCYFVVRPYNVQHVFCELQNPYYDRYVLLFTNKLEDKTLIEIAQHDVLSLITKVYEIYIDCIFEDENLYIIDQRLDILCGATESATKNSCNNATSKASNSVTSNINNLASKACNHVTRISEGITSILKTLGLQPTMYVQKNCDILEQIAQEIIKDTETLSSGGQLLMIHRSLDMYTPLMYSWTFQSLIYDFLPYSNGIVHLKNKAYSLSDNKVFQRLKFLDINTATNELKSYYKTINETKVSLNVVETIEEKIKKNEIAETLLNIQNYIADECVKNKDLSDLEHHIIKKKLKLEDIIGIVKNKNISHDKRLKLLLVYAMKNKIDMFSAQKSGISGSNITNVLASNFCEFMPYITNFLRIYKPFSAETPFYKKDIDNKLGYTPVVSNVVEKFFRSDLSNKKYNCYRKTDKNPNTYIICFVGGMTYLEYKAISEKFANKAGRDDKLIIIADKMTGWKDIYRNLK